MEWEIWPNFLHRARRRGARIAVLNGRISDRGLRRGQRGSFFTRPGLDAVNRFAMQSDEDARRAVLVGADPARVLAVGNTKFDESVTPLTAEERRALRSELQLSDNAPVWVCGSTRPGEEAIIADALKIVLAQQPALRLIVAPRHLDRAEEAAAAFTDRGFEVTTRSRKGGLSSAPVLLLDTFGELGRVYAVADVAFVGGSLVPIGGHNVLEPAALAVPIVVGPYMFNFAEINQSLTAAGASLQVLDGDELGAAITRLFADGALRKRVGHAAQQAFEREQGSVLRTLAIVEKALDNEAAKK